MVQPYLTKCEHALLLVSSPGFINLAMSLVCLNFYFISVRYCVVENPIPSWPI